jgi:hypothetical protein
MTEILLLRRYYLREHACRIGEQIPPVNLRAVIDDLRELLPAPREGAGR